MKGKFITFEGGEGAGKSLQIKRFAEYLRAQGKEVIVTREPGGTEVGKEIRKLLVEGSRDKFDVVAELLLFYADRRIHLEKVIKPAVLEGKYVISDRFNDSTIAYQYYGSKKFADRKILDLLYNIVAGDFGPDLTVLLDVDVEVGLNRSFKKAETMENKELRFENEEVCFHQRLKDGYLELAKNEPDRFVVVNANGGVDEVFDELVTKVTEKL
ncbi:MAG: dTMP kinase [Alphaproteobacteria bacterium]|nr:dTMP kinase [Alphaproteobacteria bacterium]